VREAVNNHIILTVLAQVEGLNVNAL